MIEASQSKVKRVEKPTSTDIKLEELTKKVDELLKLFKEFKEGKK